MNIIKPCAKKISQIRINPYTEFIYSSSGGYLSFSVLPYVQKLFPHGLTVISQLVTYTGPGICTPRSEIVRRTWVGWLTE